MKIPKVPAGYKRQWVKCKQCGGVAYYDYVPYSLSTAIPVLPCGHSVVGRLYDAVVEISADEALQELPTHQEADHVSDR